MTNKEDLLTNKEALMTNKEALMTNKEADFALKREIGGKVRVQLDPTSSSFVNPRMEYGSDGVVEWWSGGVVEWWSGGVAARFANDRS